MIAKGVISIGTNIRITIPIQRLRTSIKTYSASGSSSDSSSDSDSDAEYVHKIKNHEQCKTIGDSSIKTSSLNDLIDKVAQENNNGNTMDIAIPLRKTTTQKSLRTKQNLSYKAQLTEAVENVTNILSGDKKEVKFQLLDKLSHIKNNGRNKERQRNPGNWNTLVTNLMENQHGNTGKNRNAYNTESQKPKTGIIHKLKAQEKRKEQKQATGNIANIKQYQYQADQRNFRQKPISSIFNAGDYTIFKNMKEPTTVVPELFVWKSLEQRELALLSTQSPQNIFQEMIQWTESGKLWSFPIDNEYGMEQEHNVHFSEHVFLERHLKDWCPKRGPVRHFMELVCIGLSKNPYMTVDEKVEHIAWYKDYFKGKEELLKELGAIDVSSSTKEQIKT